MIRVESAGLRATVQDAGRTRHLRQGVPTAGPADRIAHAFANALVGNAPGDAAIEIAGLPFAFVAERPMLVAITGREVRLVGRDPLPGWTAVFLRAGDAVRVEGRSRYAYLAAAGGFATNSDLGSRAAYPPASLGAVPLAAGSRIALGGRELDAPRAGRSVPPPEYTRLVVRAIAGPHDDRVDGAAFFGAEFRVDERSDRMGVRLRGTRVATSTTELVTAGVAEGAVQIPHGGDPIVLLADHQTTGGYPVVATVIAADLPLLAQREPGEAVRFAPVADAEAVAALQRVRRDVFAARDASD